MTKPETWTEKLAHERKRLGRDLHVDELMALACTHTMTPSEIEKQRASFVRGMMPTGDPRFD